MPIYSAIFANVNSKNPKPNTVIVATEFGVFATDDITRDNSSIVWTDENAGFPRMLTFGIRQQTLPEWNCNNSGKIYVATHGRGFWSSEKFFVKGFTGIKNETEKIVSYKSTINIYPNPINGSGTIAFELNKTATNVLINIYDLQGRVVKTNTIAQLQAGAQKINIDTEELSMGTYLVSIDAENIHAASKFVVLK